MRFFSRAKDGGPKSTVVGYWLVELKKLFSVVLLRFDDGSRDEFHSHAFNSLSWVLRGRLVENHIDGRVEEHRAGLWPVTTRRSTFHRVVSQGTTWVVSFRGPWSDHWHEFDPKTGELTTLADGRVEVPIN